VENLVPEKDAPVKKMPRGVVNLMFAGDMVMAKCGDRSLSGLFRRYESLFETFANMDKQERLINYCFLNGLILTSHAKKSETVEDKKRLFDLKNELYLKLANDRNCRKKLAFKYLLSKNFRVLKFCEACEKKNTEENLNRHNWKFCKDCDVDHNFYNVLSMHHKFESGSVTLFISNDLIPKIVKPNLNKKGKLEDVKEEAVFQKYHYNIRNLDAIDVEKSIVWHGKLMKAQF
jgi:hypothetical protein